MSGRACNGCSMCCYAPEIEVLSKPPDVWCSHCTTHSCKIYETRPDPCRDFKCAWIENPKVADHWYPKRARMLLYTSKWDDGPVIIIRVHPKYPTRWRESPYYHDIKVFSERGLKAKPRMYTHVVCANDRWFILPTRDIHNPQPGTVFQRPDGSFDYLPKTMTDAANAFLNKAMGRPSWLT